MSTPLIWAWLIVTGAAATVGAWVLSGDAIVVIIATIAWLLVSGWVISQIQRS